VLISSQGLARPYARWLLTFLLRLLLTQPLRPRSLLKLRRPVEDRAAFRAVRNGARKEKQKLPPRVTQLEGVCEYRPNAFSRH
jgi:hypothetical protein